MAGRGPVKQSAVQSPNILSMGERTPADLPRTMVWLGDRMHFKVTEFKSALRNEDLDSVHFFVDEAGSRRFELVVRLSSVYREKMIWYDGATAGGASKHCLPAHVFALVEEVLEPLSRNAAKHLAFRRSLVATLNYLLFDDGRIVLTEPLIQGPYMDPILVGDAEELPPPALPAPPAAAAAGQAAATAKASLPPSALTPKSASAAKRGGAPAAAARAGPVSSDRPKRPPRTFADMARSSAVGRSGGPR
ncbi:unnamed protein product [Symbiodinium sp. KB8]|nr:unnamed protein product [Symbiodinium sp. KB8]